MPSVCGRDPAHTFAGFAGLAVGRASHSSREIAALAAFVNQKLPIANQRYLS
jgi:hypothetical protein